MIDSRFSAKKKKRVDVLSRVFSKIDDDSNSIIFDEKKKEKKKKEEKEKKKKNDDDDDAFAQQITASKQLEIQVFARLVKKRFSRSVAKK
jgi:hypothetical protein